MPYHYFCKIEFPKLSWSCVFWDRAILPESKKNPTSTANFTYRKSHKIKSLAQPAARSIEKISDQRVNETRGTAMRQAAQHYVSICTFVPVKQVN